MDPLTALREYTIRKDLDKIVRTGDDFRFGFDYTFPATVETAYRSKHVQSTRYTLETLVHFITNQHLKHTEYIQNARSLRIPAVTLPDRKPLLDYLTGKISSSDSIDFTSKVVVAAPIRNDLNVVPPEAEEQPYFDDSIKAEVDINPIEWIKATERPLRDREQILICNIFGILAMHTLPMPFTSNEEETNKATIYFQQALTESQKESYEGGKVSDEKISQMFSIFMTRIVNLDELVDVASRYLVGFQQALEFIRRPSIDMRHIVLERLMRANSTRKLSSYIEAGCFNNYDSKQNISKLHTCHLGLLDHVVKAKKLVKELESLLDDAEEAVLAAMDKSQDNDVHFSSYGLSQTSKEKDSPSVHRKRDITDYAILMASVFWMVKKDFKMQEKVVCALSLKSCSEELESYCMMWSLRPFIDDEFIQKAWRYVG